MPPIWEREGLSREEYGRRHLTLAFDVYFDEGDKEYQGDIRYDDLQRRDNNVLASERWRSAEASEPPHIRHLVNGETYILGQLPLGSVFKMPDGTQHRLEMYNYQPKPSKGSAIEIDNQISDLNNSLIVKHGAFTELGKTEVTFLSHPNKKHFAKPSKSAAGLRTTARSKSPKKAAARGSASSKIKVPSWMQRPSSPKAVIKTPSKSTLYKKKAALRIARVASAKRTKRRKLGNKARTVSSDKLSPKKSTRRKKSA